MFFSKKSAHPQEVDLILDVGNGSVAASLVLFKKDFAPKIIFSKRLPIAISDKVHKEKLSALVLQILKETLALVSTEGLARMRSLGLAQEKVRHTFCVLSSPWYTSKTKMLTIEHDTPLFVTKGLIDSLLEKEEELFIAEVVGRKTETPDALKKNDIYVIEKKILHTRLNGYTTTNPYKKSARHIELAMFLSFASKEIVSAIERIVGMYFHPKHIEFFSFALAEYNVVGDMFSGESNYAFMDISAEVTDMSLVEKQVLLQTISFPSGRNALIKTVAAKLDVPPDVALSSIKMMTRGHAEEGVSQNIAAACEEAKRSWSAYFFKSLSMLAADRLPSKLFVTIDDDVAPLFVSAIKENVSLGQKNSVDFQQIPVVLLDEEKMSQLVEFDPISFKDPFIALEAVFFNKLFGA